MRFSLGLLDKIAAQHIICSEPRTMKAAVHAYNLYKFAQATIATPQQVQLGGGMGATLPHLGTPPPPQEGAVPKVQQLQEESYPSEEDFLVCQVDREVHRRDGPRFPYKRNNMGKNPHKPLQAVGDRPQREDLRDLILKLSDRLDKQGKMIERLSEDVRGVVKKFRVGCYICQDPSHIARECPKRNIRSLEGELDSEEGDLNENGDA